ncbi:cytochrome P450 [Hypoxylon sp. FL1284]|nr:cytochrome P450 [Hypoxylon sp. FL1284]
MEILSKAHEVLSWWNFATVLIVYVVVLVSYRLVLHPLAQFPGPKLAAATRFYEAYFDIVCGGQYTLKIADLHRKYGPIVRISPYELHVIDPSYHEKLYRQEGRWDKYEWTYDAFSAKGATLSTGPHNIHKTRRLAISHFFSKARVASRQHVIDQNVAKLCSRLSEFAGKTVDLGAALSAVTRDISCEFNLNKTYGALDKDDFNVSMTKMFRQGGAIWRMTKHFPWFGPAMQSIPRSLMFKLANEGTREFFQYIQDCEEDTKNLLSNAAASPAEQVAAPRTIVHEIVDSKLPPEEKTFLRVLDEVRLVTGAGFETTASVMRLICYHAFSNSTILQRLRAELDTASGQSSSGEATIDLKMLERLPYLTSVIMEGMRLSPGIGSRMSRISPDKDTFYGDIRIPSGTPVSMTAILMHTDETLYPDPLSFNPERWMDVEARKKLDKTFAPFSKGTRMCLGMHLAWAEMYIMLAALIRRFDFNFQDIEVRDLELESDQYTIGVKAGAVLKAYLVPRSLNSTVQARICVVGNTPNPAVQPTVSKNLPNWEKQQQRGSSKELDT